MKSATRALALVLPLAIFGSVSSGTAHASDTPKDKSDAQGRSDAPSAPSGGATTATGATGGSTTNTEEFAGLLDARRIGSTTKWWEVGLGFEEHVLGLKLTGSTTDTNTARNAVVEILYAFVGLNLTKYDRLTLREGISIHPLPSYLTNSLVDLNDLSLSYTRRIPLSHDVTIRLIAALTAPISAGSQHSNLLTAPSATFDVSWGRAGWSLDARAFGSVYVRRNTSSSGPATPSGGPSDFAGGATNAAGLFGGTVAVDYSFWFHKRLSIGADAFAAYVKSYNVYNTGPNTSPGMQNSVYNQVYQDIATPSQQPLLELYGWEFFLRYSIPTFYGIKSDLTVAFTNGDPSISYNSLIHDGIDHFYGLYRTTAYGYAALNVRY